MPMLWGNCKRAYYIVRGSGVNPARKPRRVPKPDRFYQQQMGSYRMNKTIILILALMATQGHAAEVYSGTRITPWHTYTPPGGQAIYVASICVDGLAWLITTRNSKTVDAQQVFIPHDRTPIPQPKTCRTGLR